MHFWCSNGNGKCKFCRSQFFYGMFRKILRKTWHLALLDTVVASHRRKKETQHYEIPKDSVFNSFYVLAIMCCFDSTIWLFLRITFRSKDRCFIFFGKYRAVTAYEEITTLQIHARLLAAHLMAAPQEVYPYFSPMLIFQIVNSFLLTLDSAINMVHLISAFRAPWYATPRPCSLLKKVRCT